MSARDVPLRVSCASAAQDAAVWAGPVQCPQVGAAPALVQPSEPLEPERRPMSIRSGVITAEMKLHLIVPTGHALPLLAELRYDADDPYAVCLEVHASLDERPQDGTVWIFARDLLADGIRRPAGVGDVRVGPSSTSGVRRVRIALCSPAGSAVLEASHADLVTFLSATYAVVPAGSEAGYQDLDAEIARLR